MKKTIKNILLFLFLSLFLVCGFFMFFLTGNIVKASTNMTDENEYFEFVNGTSMGFNPSVDEPTVEDVGLRFRVNLKDYSFDSIGSSRNGTFYSYNILGQEVFNSQIYYENILTVNRVNSNGLVTPIYEMVINYTVVEASDTGVDGLADDVYFIKTIWEKHFYSSSEYFYDFTYRSLGSQVVDSAYTTLLLHDSLNREYSSNDYVRVGGYLLTTDDWLFSSDDIGSDMYWDLYLLNVSPYVDYNVTYKYNFREHSGSANLGSYYNLSGELTSKTDSVYSLLSRMDSAGAIDSTAYPELCRSILSSFKARDVLVSYLVPIEGTPFATSVLKFISVCFYGADLRLDDVCSVLGVDSLDVYDAHVSGFEIVDGVFVAQYYKSFWLRATTAEGHSFNYFNDINKSYAEFFYPFVESGVFDKGAYDYMFNALLTKYPGLSPYQTSPDCVYGLWGMATLPETYSIDAIWKDVFSTSSTKGEHVTMFSYTRQLSLSEYNSLLKTYEFNWLEQIWNNLGGFIDGMSCSNYVFFAEPNTEVSWLDMTGRTDDKDDVIEHPDNPGIITPLPGDVINGGFDWIKDGISFVRSWSSTFLIVGVVFIGVSIFVKIKNKK